MIDPEVLVLAQPAKRQSKDQRLAYGKVRDAIKNGLLVRALRNRHNKPETKP